MQKLTLAVLITLVTCGASMAQTYAPPRHPRHPPQAVRQGAQTWPGRPMCDDGGYRIRPCDMSGGRGGG